MLIIRQTQLEQLSEPFQERFKKDMHSYLKKYFPAKYEQLEKEEVDEIIRYGIKRANDYEIKEACHLCLYIDLMFAFGRDFDCDPALPWASRILDSDLNSERKVRYLFDTAQAHLQDTTDTSTKGLRSNNGK